MNKKRNYKEAYPKNQNGTLDASLDREHSPFKALAHRALISKYAAGKKILPLHVRIGLTNKCNLRCNFCNFHSDNEKDFYNMFNYDDTLEKDKVINFLKEFSENGGRAVTFCGSGECTIHPYYKEICYKAHEFGLKIGLITNGSVLNTDELLKCITNTHTWVRIGLNAGTPDTYANITHYRASNFNEILEAVKYLSENAKENEFRIGVNFVITLENYFEIVQAATLAKSAKAYYVRFEPEFYSALAHETIYGRLSDINQMLAEAKRLSDDKFEVSIPKLDRGAMRETEEVEGDFEKCHYCNFVTALGADGFIYPCPQVHLSEKYRMGNVIEQGYSKWINSSEKEKWEEENSNRKEKCKTCFYRPQNELLEWILNGSLNIEETLSRYEQEYPETLHKDFV